ncbi:DUF1419 domain-containing protein [Rhizobium sp. NXC24]|uniref:DUF1419 domain-containing protein n=1 Tax=Rhizobium sp. NXC24 TaxID=2048897 RepID=UPI000CDF524C|nr:DUF1419 domain-containing protein [Rhizobium sp. NXC24]AVA24405.1 hypothetical protein NXC24_PB00480 [Rhizobium sp. NXC24]
MTSSIRKVFQGIATRQQMFRMFDRHAQRPDRSDGDASPLRWRMVRDRRGRADYMFEFLPPLWIRGSLFAMREFLTGRVTSVFFALRIDEAIRYFHGYCNLSEKASVDTMRVAIMAREAEPAARPKTRVARCRR